MHLCVCKERDGDPATPCAHCPPSQLLSWCLSLVHQTSSCFLKPTHTLALEPLPDTLVACSLLPLVFVHVALSREAFPPAPQLFCLRPCTFSLYHVITFSNTGFFLIVHTNSLMAGDFVWLLRAPSLVLEQHWAQRGQQDAKQVFVDKSPLRLLSF